MSVWAACLLRWFANVRLATIPSEACASRESTKLDVSCVSRLCVVGIKRPKTFTTTAINTTTTVRGKACCFLRRQRLIDDDDDDDDIVKILENELR